MRSRYPPRIRTVRTSAILTRARLRHLCLMKTVKTSPLFCAPRVTIHIHPHLLCCRAYYSQTLQVLVRTCNTRRRFSESISSRSNNCKMFSLRVYAYASPRVSLLNECVIILRSIIVVVLVLAGIFERYFFLGHTPTNTAECKNILRSTIQVSLLSRNVIFFCIQY